MENKRGGGFWKGLLVFGVGLAAGYLAAKKLDISLKKEDDWDCCCCDDEDDCCDSDCGCSCQTSGKEEAAPSAESLEDDEDLKF